ncbi:hypothetical protein ACXDF8_23670 [Mycolicibacterium sp. CBM1]
MHLLNRTLITGAAAAVLTVGAAVAATATAVADPPPVDPALPVDPAPPPPAQGLLPPQAAISDSLNGFANYIAGDAGQQLLLGQTPTPAVAGTAPASPPSVDILDGAQMLMPQNYRVPTPDQTSPYQLAPGVPGPFARVDAYKGVHAMLHGALGRMPADQLGQPLPGTAPPPGTNIPAGPEQFLPDSPPPPDPALPAASADPALLPPPPPA